MSLLQDLLSFATLNRKQRGLGITLDTVVTKAYVLRCGQKEDDKHHYYS